MNKYIAILLFLFCSSTLHAQIEKVIVETYYISDSNDATDTIGGGLTVGSKTYRIYVDLKPGSTLKKIYGDANHPLKFSSTSYFFNNKEDGQTFAKDFNKNRYGENTVALDSWLTLGQTTKTSAKTYFGVLKEQDNDGSFIGGANNDGGSESVVGGLMVNSNSTAGKSLVTADGMEPMTDIPTSWADYGFKNSITGIDSTIFGSIVKGTQFISYNAQLQNSGVMGVVPDSNQILIAQLTTTGDISFELNLEVETDNGNIKYVANDSAMHDGEVLSSYLKYPPSCGCKDPNYLEYSPRFGCNLQDSCKHLIVLGCADPMACNYDPNVNYNVQDLCCYVGYCNDRDISVVCPLLSVDELKDNFIFSIYPNPAQKFLTLKLNTPRSESFSYDIYDMIGRCVLKNAHIENTVEQIDVSGFPNGSYLIRLSSGYSYFTKTFTKN